jgi:uncharacterized membrane protein YeaQ/YmgE (transglycosylase-associated protein family)
MSDDSRHSSDWIMDEKCLNLQTCLADGRRAAAANDRVVQGGEHMGILSWVILGLIAGFIGSRIVDRRGQGFWLDIAIGIIGALVGGFVFNLFGASGVTGLNIYSMIVAVAGSIVVLVIYNTVMGRRRA